MSHKQGAAIHITGVVQGVGFRPFVYTLALRCGITGWVRNTSAGVDIRADAAPDALAAFVAALRSEAPPLAHIDTLTIEQCAANGFDRFEIQASTPQPGAFQPVSADIAICDDCRRELRDPADPRYRYPFINCTNCGPRFTIIKDVPYDRPATTMDVFPMCDRCDAEYHDPLDRRFHAQPVACPDCGPQVWLTGGDGVLIAQRDDAIRAAAARLAAGEIVAIKGLGGFHLACDATNAAAVNALRRRKGRPDKPFALMMADLTTVRRYCLVDAAEAAVLHGPASPILLVQRRETCDGPAIVDAVAPRQATLGVMLPYTPLHLLLFDEGLPPLVMTSGNFSDEPIATSNDEALSRFAPLADALLLHDRAIHIRTDDSVVRLVDGAELPLRRSRGYAPYPVYLPFDLPPLLAVGGEMKNTFCVVRDRYAFNSHHIGTMENYETLQSFEGGVAHFERLFRIEPRLIAHDLHPDYLATRYALARAKRDGLPAVAVQHHHAHIASCMVENGHDGTTPVIGVCFDGTGYGSDGTIWGGEFLLADYARFERAAHLKPTPLPGGDAATRKPARIALAALLAAGLPLDESLPPFETLDDVERRVVMAQAAGGPNTPLTSSVGRLFDAVSSLLGVCQVATYEGQAAIELEAIVDPAETGAYAFGLDALPHIDPSPVLAALLADHAEGLPTGRIAARFHNGVAAMVAATCEHLRQTQQLNEVALTGGVFQNVTLLRRTLALLQEAGFRVLTHHKVPPNDGGLALGQAVIATHLTPESLESDS